MSIGNAAITGFNMHSYTIVNVDNANVRGRYLNEDMWFQWNSKHNVILYIIQYHIIQRNTIILYNINDVKYVTQKVVKWQEIWNEKFRK